MTKFYSKTVRGFFDDTIHGEDMPADAIEVSDEDYAALFEAQSRGQVIVPNAKGAPVAADPQILRTPAQSAAALSGAVQAHVDATARSLGYDNILAAISYADEPSVPKFQAEGVALRAWRSAIWTAAAPAIDVVAVGGVVPSAAALLATLPAFTPPTV